MLVRALFLAACGCAACGCTAPSPPPQKLALGASSAEVSRRAVSLAPASQEARPSESARVMEDKADPEAARLFKERMGQAAVPLAATTTPPRVTEIRLDDTRRGEAPGMQPAGAIFTATLAEGQRGTMPVKLAPGDCETFIAQGGLGVIEVDLFITTEDASRVLKEDTETGPIAVIGGHGKCFAGATGTGTAALLHAAVRRGAGVVLVRAYKK